MSECIASGCNNEAKGHFCDVCWKLLRWDHIAAITASRRAGGSIHKRNIDKAKNYLDELQQSQGEN